MSGGSSTAQQPVQGGAGCQHLQRQGSCGLPTMLGDTTAWPQTALLGFAILVTFPWGNTSTLTRVWLWALLSTTRMIMEICIISTLAAPVRSLGGEADSCRSSPCWPLALALLVALEHSTLLPATGQCTVASHASQDPHGPMETNTCGGPGGTTWASHPSQEAKTKTSSSLVPLSGARTSCGTLAWPSLLLRTLSSTTISLQQGAICWAWIRTINV